MACWPQGRHTHQKGCDSYATQREVDVEDPAPVDVVGKIATDKGAGHAGGSENTGKQAVPLSSLGGRKDITDDGKGYAQDQPCSKALHGSKGDHHFHGLGGASQGGPE